MTRRRFIDYRKLRYERKIHIFASRVGLTIRKSNVRRLVIGNLIKYSQISWKYVNLPFNRKVLNKLTYSEDEMYVTCPICGHKAKMLHHHIRGSAHNMSVEEFREKYPDSPLSSKYYIDRCSDGAKAMINKYGQTKLTEGKLNSELFHNQKSAQMRELAYANHANPDIREKIEGFKKGKFHLGSLKEYELSNGQKVYLRSGFELRMYEYLLKSGLDFSYESLSIPYEIDGKTKTYHPDFFIPKFNLVIEVKPETYQKWPIFKAKLDGIKKTKYNFIVISEDEIYEEEKVMNLINQFA